MPAERARPEGTAPPDAELLEFLGSWQTATGEWPESPASDGAPDAAEPAVPQTVREPNRE